MKATLGIFTLAIFTFSLQAASEQRTIELEPHIIHYKGQLPVAVEQELPVVPARIAGKEGYVLLKFEISENGRVSDIRVKEKTNRDMAKFCRSMVRDWKYENPGESITVHQPVFFEETSERPMLFASL